MRKLHVKGVVRAANHVRKMLSAPMTIPQRDALARQIEDSVGQVEAILDRNDARPDHLPAPSRCALTFLKQVDLSRVRLREADGEGTNLLPETVSFPGLRAFMDQLLDDIALNVDAGTLKGEATRLVIRHTTDRLNRTVRQDGLRAEHLKPVSRCLLGWLRTFAEAEAFGVYTDAVGRAQRVWADLPFDRLGWKGPSLVHFRPSGHVYRCREVSDGMRIVLETPMLTFSDSVLRKVGRQILGSRAHHREVTSAMLAPEYQAWSFELEQAVGVVERPAGLIHDLAESFERVNAEYFAGGLDRPRLRWNSTITRCTFGHYDFVHDILWVSRTLDREGVPRFVVDHVMHHELLHKKHGFEWHGRQQHTHTPAFRAEERSFKRYDEAARFLSELSASTR